MKIKSLGHSVLKVKDRLRFQKFYNGILGLPICARLDQDGFKMAFFSLGNHLDFTVMEVSSEGGSQSETAAGLHQVSFKICTSLDELREGKAKLQEACIAPTPYCSRNLSRNFRGQLGA